MLNYEKAPAFGTVYATFIDRVVFRHYDSLDEVTEGTDISKLLELHLFDKEKELRIVKNGAGEWMQVLVTDEDCCDKYVESVYLLGEDTDKTDSLEGKVEVVNYIMYDENDLLHIVNYRLKEKE